MSTCINKRLNGVFVEKTIYIEHLHWNKTLWMILDCLFVAFVYVLLFDLLFNAFLHVVKGGERTSSRLPSYLQRISIFQAKKLDSLEKIDNLSIVVNNFLLFQRDSTFCFNNLTNNFKLKIINKQITVVTGSTSISTGAFPTINTFTFILPNQGIHQVETFPRLNGVIPGTGLNTVHLSCDNFTSLFWFIF